MSFDLHANLIEVTVVDAPVPATSGTTLNISNADRTILVNAGLTVPFNGTVSLSSGRTPSNSEIIRITTIGAADSGGAGKCQLTITRTAEPVNGASTARSILVSDVIKITITAKALTDIEVQINNKILQTQVFS